MITRTQIGSLKIRVLPSLLSHTSSLPSESSSFTEALKCSHWIRAMAKEYNSLMANNIWELVPRPFNVNVIGCH